VTLRPTGIDAIEGFYVTLILDQLHRAGILREIAKGRDTAAVARRFGVDQATLTRLLEYVALRSDVVDRVGRGTAKRFSLSKAAGGPFLGQLLDQYVGAYGPCLAQLSRILKAPAVGAKLVDGKRHAAAFAHNGPPPELVAIIEALGFSTVLDIGCGGGQLLTTLALRRADFSGIGIDANPHMVAVARRRASKLGLKGRIDVRHGSVATIRRTIPKRNRDRIGGICGVSVANSFFAKHGGHDIDFFLGRLKSLFADRILVLCDYYSRLGASTRHSARYQRSLVHDVAQLVSSQGLPPANLDDWRRIYARNSVKLLQAYRAADGGVARFIHIVRL
jgi:2-polyprenyl-3-methyl-5-hydroxy-6-metoxy-1,4-benzoquinol methylase